MGRWGSREPPARKEDIEDEEPLLELAKGKGSSLKPSADCWDSPRAFVIDKEDGVPNEDQSGAIELGGVSRTSRSRKATARFSPVPATRRRKDKARDHMSPDEEINPSEVATSPLPDAMDKNLDDVVPEEVEGSRPGRGRLRKAGSGRGRVRGNVKRRRASSEPDDDVEEAEIRSKTSRAGRGRGNRKTREGKPVPPSGAPGIRRRRSSNLEQSQAEQSGVVPAPSAAAMEAPKQKQKQENQPPKPAGAADTNGYSKQEPWEHQEDRAWAQDIDLLQQLVDEFCRKEGEALKLRNNIQEMLEAWAGKAAPSMEVLSRTKVGRFLKNRMVKRGPEDSLLDVQYARTVLKKWQREYISDKEAKAQPSVEETPSTVPVVSKPKEKEAAEAAAPAKPEPQVAPHEPSNSRPTQKPPAAKEALPGVTAIKVEAPQGSAAARAIVEKAERLEARQPAPPSKGDEDRDKCTAILLDALQPAYLPTQIAVLLEELLHKAFAEKGQPGMIYKRKLHLIWLHLSSSGSAYNPALREGLLGGALPPHEVLAMSADELSKFSVPVSGSCKAAGPSAAVIGEGSSGGGDRAEGKEGGGGEARGGEAVGATRGSGGGGGEPAVAPAGGGDGNADGGDAGREAGQDAQTSADVASLEVKHEEGALSACGADFKSVVAWEEAERGAAECLEANVKAETADATEVKAGDTSREGPLIPPPPVMSE